MVSGLFYKETVKVHVAEAKVYVAGYLFFMEFGQFYEEIAKVHVAEVKLHVVEYFFFSGNAYKFIVFLIWKGRCDE